MISKLRRSKFLAIKFALLVKGAINQGDRKKIKVVNLKSYGSRTKIVVV